MLSVLLFVEADFVVYLLDLVLDRRLFVETCVDLGLRRSQLIIALLNDVLRMADPRSRRLDFCLHAFDLVTGGLI